MSLKNCAGKYESYNSNQYSDNKLTHNSSMKANARHKREQLVASRAPKGRVFDGDCYKPDMKRTPKLLLTKPYSSIFFLGEATLKRYKKTEKQHSK